MKLVLLGHRGTGKSHLLERLKVYLKASNPQTKFFDLDREIEFREGKTIGQIFTELGEARFRELEIQVFKQLVLGQPDFVISLGAGFALQEIPNDCRRLWVRRKTDALGRIFLNRPRLNPEISPLDEYLQRLPLREERYRKYATEEYIMPEGIEGPNPVEQRIFQEDFRNLGGILTLLPGHFQNMESLQNRIRNFDVDFFELRDDLLTLQQIQTVTSLLPPRRVLISLRQRQTNKWLREFLRTGGVWWDWAMELGTCTFGPAPVYSIHQMDSTSLVSLDDLEMELARHRIPESAHIKLSPVTHNFQELSVLLEWQAQDPANRSILPRSTEFGKWNWIRQWLKGRQKINFFRLDQGSALDQPTLYEWMATPFHTAQFAALLGHPIFHSRTPIEQQEYFSKKNHPVFGIDIEQQDLNAAMALLPKLGLDAAAVTSPLKSGIYNWTPYRSTLASELESANTLVRKDQVWYSHNTDLDGFRALFSQITGDTDSVAVWGGGGTLPVILKVVPHALCFSARSKAYRLEHGDQQKRSRD